MNDNNIQNLINLYKSGKFSIAEKKVIKLIKKDPNNFFLLNLFGIILASQEKLDKAIINYRKSIKINPNYIDAYNNLGGAFLQLKKFNECINILQAAIKINPNFAQAYYNLGNAFKEMGKLDESIHNYQRAIQINPNYSKAYNNLANTFRDIGKLDESIHNYQRAIEVDPNFAQAYYNLGNTFRDIGKLDETIHNYQRAIQINPTYFDAYNNLGNIFIDIGKVDDARKCFKKLFILKPKNIGYKINNGLLITPITQSVKEIVSLRDQYKKGLKSLKKYKFLEEEPGNIIEANFFYLAFHNKDNLEIMKKTSSMFRKIIPNICYVSKNIKKRKKQKKIKIGFISEFLTEHTVGKLFGGLIKNIDRKKFDVIIFHTAQTKKSLIKNEIDNSANKVINLRTKIQDQQQQVEKENLNIVFYPDIGMSPTTYFLAFSRIAPVQIVTWGHPETTGINTIDYFLSSALLEPNRRPEKKYSERLVCLSQFPLYYEPPQNIGSMKQRKDLGLPENVRLYGCPQTLFKLHPDFDAVLAKILLQDPKGYIVLIGGEGKAKYWLNDLKKRWSKNFSILNKRVLFTNRLTLLEFISLCNCVDVLLDPIHFGGGNSFLEAMKVGTPTVTMPGTHLKTNITAAAYKQMKISAPPIVKSIEEYINLSVKLAQDSKINFSLREESKIAANKYLYKNLKALREFEKFLEKAYKAAQSGSKLKDGCVIN
jgi:predicted O-linked N-acetylglucosamine transferase (SPINDLY family)